MSDEFFQSLRLKENNAYQEPIDAGNQAEKKFLYLETLSGWGLRQ
jgi:hypothetical protein